MDIRTALPRDLGEIGKILDASFNPIYAYFARQSFVSHQNALIAEDRGRLSGAVNWRIFRPGRDRIGYLFWLAVHPDYRGQGIGRSLVLAAVGRMSARLGAAPIYVSIARKNVASRELFAGAGFRPIGRSAMRMKYGARCYWLFFRMMLAPHEDLFVKPPRAEAVTAARY